MTELEKQTYLPGTLEWLNKLADDEEKMLKELCFAGEEAEIELKARIQGFRTLAEYLRQMRHALLQSRDTLGSIKAVADRNGYSTNWDAFKADVDSALNAAAKAIRQPNPTTQTEYVARHTINVELNHSVINSILLNITD